VIAEITAEDKVESYITGVLSGTITVGSLVRAAVERHVADLKKQDSQEFPYYFDKEAAEKKCQFFPKILRHSVGEWAGRPFHLEPWQAFMVWSIHGWKRLDGTRRFRKVYI
jgi:phage terminase large subunit-like protein